ncbi:hypothetical protein LB504_006009, partial [Fusarium proliferatum]
MAPQLVIDTVATRAYTHAHGDTAFTSTNMIARTNDPKTYENIVRRYGVGKLSTSGTCTVLAIRVAMALDHENPGVYNFRMYDVGNHKICRCLNTYTIIDSSSRNGAIVKAPGDEWPYKRKKFVWQFDGSVVVTDGTQTTVMNWIPFEEGLASTLRQVAETTNVVTYFRQELFSFLKLVISLILFRFTNRFGCRFFKGFMKWYLEGDDDGTSEDLFSRYLLMAASLEARDKNDEKNIWRIVWREGVSNHQDETGNATTNQQCKNQMKQFVKEFGSKTQWYHDNCHRVHHQIWDALVKKYGYPVLKMGWGPQM